MSGVVVLSIFPNCSRQRVHPLSEHFDHRCPPSIELKPHKFAKLRQAKGSQKVHSTILMTRLKCVTHHTMWKCLVRAGCGWRCVAAASVENDVEREKGARDSHTSGHLMC